jgi:hypothetical protein
MGLLPCERRRGGRVNLVLLGLTIQTQIGSEGLMQKLCVGIVIYDEVEVLDFCGPFEVFSVT